jgi:hypothetical protein
MCFKHVVDIQHDEMNFGRVCKFVTMHVQVAGVESIEHTKQVLRRTLYSAYSNLMSMKAVQGIIESIERKDIEPKA